MSKINVAGEPFNIRLDGKADAPVLILAHQLGGALAVWDRLAPALSAHFRVLRYDSRGHGASVANPGPYSIAALARDAIGLLDALKIEKAHWIGLSMGAIVGQAVMLLAPARIGRAILANTAAQLGTPDLWNARIGAVRAGGGAGMAGATEERWFTPAFRQAEPAAVQAVMDDFRATPIEGYASACGALRDADLREAVRSIRHETLVIVGARDPSAPPALAAYVASVIEGARLVTLETSHISPVEDAEGFLEAALEFLTAPEHDARAGLAAGRTAPRRKSLQRLLTGRAPAKKAPGKKAVAKKAPAKKALAKKSAAKKTAPKKSAANKTASAKKGTKQPGETRRKFARGAPRTVRASKDKR
ncbi:3-oxoadipate enol-lactonase [Methylocella silvestris]|uniref:3-oxoadipate enol-lactonase n=1 Tax=Methylocella silvestris TaxID=199596 RepID=UPI001AEC7480|nr:3-oxoadipate enol-lactonase [Methylocella silvestris]